MNADLLVDILAFSLLLIANIAIGALGFIPSILITPLNLEWFGLTGGIVLSLSGEIIGALLGFWLYRYGARHIPAKLQAHKWFLYLTSQPPKKVAWAVVGLRLLPFVPSGVVTAGAAVTRLRAPLFFLASSLGKLPAVAIEIAAAYGLMRALPSELLYGLLAAGLLIATTLALYRRCKKTRNKA